MKMFGIGFMLFVVTFLMGMSTGYYANDYSHANESVWHDCATITPPEKSLVILSYLQSYGTEEIEVQLKAQFVGGRYFPPGFIDSGIVVRPFPKPQNWIQLP